MLTMILNLATQEAAGKFQKRGIYYDGEERQIRCMCHKKWLKDYEDFQYTHNFKFACHKKYETQKEKKKPGHVAPVC